MNARARLIPLLIFLLLTPACAAPRDPPPYVCMAGAAELPTGQTLQVLVCRPVHANQVDTQEAPR